MWYTRKIAARILVWLAAMSVPVQSMPASCACSDSDACCSETGHPRSCRCSATKVREGRCCCRARDRDGECQDAVSKRSCCSSRRRAPVSECTCGLNCRCGKANPPKHLPPPAENDNSTEKVAKNTLSLACVTVVSQVPARGHRSDGTANAHAYGARNRCVSLCRFML